ncbi:MAG: cytochrome c oxidase subunit II [Chloroflexi bacterium]|nr:cytochrome c oxidase subunit II [Chloroflexota bacterium]
MKKLIVPILFTIVLSTLLVVAFENADLLPQLTSVQGARIDALLRLLFIISSIAFSLIISFLLYSVVAFRRRPGDMEDAVPIHGNTALEIAWTVIPLIIVLSLAGYATDILLDITRAPSEKELLVGAIGQQWSWSFDYAEYGVVSPELVLPVNRPVMFHIQSTDVIHSFWVPEFRIKMDAIPGILNEARVTPTEVGDYTAYCSELCGTAHAYMTAPVRVIEGPAFDEWMSEQQAIVQAAEEGDASSAQYAQTFGCLGCHSTDGSELVGPTFQGLFDSQRTFDDGTSGTADETYLRESILDPGAQVVQGFSDVMRKDYADQLAEEQIEALVEFIKGLE